MGMMIRAEVGYMDEFDSIQKITSCVPFLLWAIQHRTVPQQHTNLGDYSPSPNSSRQSVVPTFAYPFTRQAAESNFLFR